MEGEVSRLRKEGGRLREELRMSEVWAQQAVGQTEAQLAVARAEAQAAVAEAKRRREVGVRWQRCDSVMGSEYRRNEEKECDCGKPLYEWVDQGCALMHREQRAECECEHLVV